MIRFGLLGCGRIAKRHSELLGGNQVEGARSAAVCDSASSRVHCQHVIDCLTDQRAALVDGVEGRHSLELISALDESIETSQEMPVRLRPRLSRLGIAT